MTRPNDPTRPIGLAATDAVDPARIGLAVTRDSNGSHADVPEDRSDPTDRSFGLASTRAPASEEEGPAALQLATARTGAIDVGTVETIDPGPRDRLARPALDDPDARRRRQALKSRLFGEAEDAVKIGRYQVLGRLGAGGMGVVYTAYDDQLDRKVAVKVLRQEGGGHAQQRLRREAQAMARLSHPNIVGVHEVGEEGDSVFVAMEFVRGHSLDRWLAEPRPWREVLAVFVAAGRGLQAAHAAGLIHRDFKPANAILGDDGTVKVLDFGLAQTEGGVALAEAGEGSLMAVRLTRTGAMMGTPAYMSPEQFSGSPLTAASDQFSFFVALYEALWRTQPFAGDSVGALALSVTRGRPIDPPAGEVPAWVRAVVLRGLARAPEDRWPDMTTALAALSADPARRRRRIAAVLGLALVSGGASAALVKVADGDSGRCEQVAAASERVWSDEHVAAARAAFAGHGALGGETWALLEPRLGGWIAGWAAARGDRCMKYAGGELSDTLHDRSVACLERQLARVEGIVEAFVVADAATVEQAPVAVVGLPATELCSDPSYLLAEVAPPEDPQARAAVADGQASLERARAAIALGDHAAALTRASEVAGIGRSLGYEPLVGQAEVVRGEALLWKQDVAGAEAALSAGLELGLASGDDHVAVEALARRIYVRAELAGEAARALDDAPIDRALLRRVASDGRLAWLVENNIGVALERGGRVAAAAESYAAAVRIATGLGDDGSFEAMVAQYNLALLNGQRGRLEPGLELLRGARAIAERIYGADHPALVMFLDGESTMTYELGRVGEAREVCRRARQIAEHLPVANPALLVPIAVLEAQIAVLYREPDAPAQVDAAWALASSTFKADSPQAANALMRPKLDRPERDAAYAAAVTVLAETGPVRGVEARLIHAQMLRAGGRVERAAAVLAEVRASGAWSALAASEQLRVVEVEAQVKFAAGRLAEARAALAEADGLVDDEARASMGPPLDFLRGRIAAAEGDHAGAVVALRRALDGYARTFDADHPELLALQAALARSLRATGATAEAEALGQTALAGYRSLGAGFEPEATALAAWLAAR